MQYPQQPYPYPPTQPPKRSTWQRFRTLGCGWQSLIGCMTLCVLVFVGAICAVAVPSFAHGWNAASITPTVAPTSSVASQRIVTIVTNTPTTKPAHKATATPTPKPTAIPTIPPVQPTPTSAPTGVNGNPWGYDFNSTGSLIYDPPADFCSYFDCIANFWKSTKGYVDECNDGTYSHSGGRTGDCSDHGGKERPLYSH